MKRFRGFPAKTGFTSIPNPFFSSILPHIDDMVELKVTLHIFWLLYRKKGYPRFATFEELVGDRALMAAVSGGRSPAEELRRGLQAAVDRGTLLHLVLQGDEDPGEAFFLNTEANQRAIAAIESGTIQAGPRGRTEPAPTEPRPNIFGLYEQHVGLLTPLIADDLKEAEESYPASWIEDAFREAARLNRRSWRYISRILERWATEGKDDGRVGESAQAEIGPREYLRKYGHLTKK